MHGNDGFIKFYRKFTHWEWYQDNNTKSLFIHLLLTANHEDKEWRGIEIKKGQIVTGLKSLSEQTGLSIQNIRTSLGKLKLTNEITIKSTNKYSIITLVNWAKYQNNLQDTNKQTNKQTNKPLTTNKNKYNYNKYNYIKEYKENKNSSSMSSDIHATATEILNYLNQKNGNDFKLTNGTMKLISERLDEGFTVDDFKDVIHLKYNEWVKEPQEWDKDKTSSDYFRPATLFGNKFEQYLQEYKRKVRESK